jgi:hypothetical protein
MAESPEVGNDEDSSLVGIAAREGILAGVVMCLAPFLS